MNIIVKPCGDSHAICRPDTTWERENKDIYLPEDIAGTGYAPVLFVRISKAGKCIGLKFASRYYDGVGYGILLYPALSRTADSGVQDGLSIAAASCIDHTSILPFPLYNKVTLESGGNRFRLFDGGREIYSTAEGSAVLVEEAIAAVSRYISLRIGDLVCIELSPVLPLLPADRDEADIRGVFCDSDIFRLTIRK